MIDSIKKTIITISGLTLGACIASGFIYVNKVYTTKRYKLTSVPLKVWGDMPIEQSISELSFIAPELKSKKDYYIGLERPSTLTGKGGGYYSDTSYHLGNLSGIYFNVNSIKNRLMQIAQNGVRKPREEMELLLEGIPVGAPVIGRLTSRYGKRVSPFEKNSDFHTGVDIATDFNSPVVASANGIILFAGYKGSYGRTVLIKHSNGIETLYAHLSRIDVKKGEFIHRGNRIGLLGSTGKSTGPHLHYEVRLNGNPINPKTYIELAKILRSVG